MAPYDDKDTQLPSLRSPLQRVDYPADASRSIWDEENVGVVSAIERLRPAGRWLNLCCGDGRYHEVLAKWAQNLIAIDLDPEALHRLVSRLSPSAKAKTKVALHDVLIPLPFASEAFDGVFCSASLHLFSPAELSFVCREIHRVLCPTGIALVDFSHSIRRELPNKELLRYPSEHEYSKDEALQVFRVAWSSSIEMAITTGEVAPHPIDLGGLNYIFSSSAFMIEIKKGV